MFAGHFAAALAIRSAEPRLPVASAVALAFAPDLLWLGLALAGIEIVDPARWSDGWSHSFASILCQAVVAAAIWSRDGVRVGAAAAALVLSHLLLDLPLHPAPLPWSPGAVGGWGDVLGGWARAPLTLGKSRGWWVEAGVVAAALAAYAAGRRRAGVPPRIAAAAALLVVSLQLAFG